MATHVNPTRRQRRGGGAAAARNSDSSSSKGHRRALVTCRPKRSAEVPTTVAACLKPRKTVTTPTHALGAWFFLSVLEPDRELIDLNHPWSSNAMH
jgi:hypothetical protein